MVQGDVLGLLDHTRTAAEFLDDSVVRDGLADHRPEMLGLEMRQVNEGVEVGGLSARWLVKNRHIAQDAGRASHKMYGTRAAV